MNLFILAENYGHQYADTVVWLGSDGEGKEAGTCPSMFGLSEGEGRAVDRRTPTDGGPCTEVPRGARKRPVLMWVMRRPLYDEETDGPTQEAIEAPAPDEGNGSRERRAVGCREPNPMPDWRSAAVSVPTSGEPPVLY